VAPGPMFTLTCINKTCRPVIVRNQLRFSYISVAGNDKVIVVHCR